jgi:predicted nucleic acid-binding protein
MTRLGTPLLCPPGRRPVPHSVDVDEAVCRDPDDAYLVALYSDAHADFLVSGDRDFSGTAGLAFVLTPHQAVDRLELGTREGHR